MYQPKVAFCFLVYDQILQPEIWNAWFSQIADRAVVLIHSSQPYVHKLSNVHVEIIPRVKTAWGDISIVEAQLALYAAALKRPDVVKLVLLSGSTIPVKEPHETLRCLLADSKSHIQFSPAAQVFPRYNNLLSLYLRDRIKKHSQWVILSRFHALYLMSAREQILQDFESAHIPDEVAIGTSLAVMGYLAADHVEETAPMLTFVDWERGDPYTFRVISDEEIERLVFNSPNIHFARKFSADTVVVMPTVGSVSLYEYMHEYLGII